MSRLYCEQHGRDDEASTIQQQELYQQEGESILTVSGRLISGPWRCDSCNHELKRGERAYLVTTFPGWMTEETPEYDFSYEREYIRIEQAEIAVYGAEWPAIRKSG